jgi:hypothetical protein
MNICSPRNQRRCARNQSDRAGGTQAIQSAREICRFARHPNSRFAAYRPDDLDDTLGAGPDRAKITGHRSRELERYQHLTPEVRALTVKLIATELCRAGRGRTEDGTPTGTVEEVSRVERFFCVRSARLQAKPHKWRWWTRPDLRLARRRSAYYVMGRKCLICFELAGATGLEPAASGVTGRRSNQLNYAPDSIGDL